jgi:hypothetical protein
LATCLRVSLAGLDRREVAEMTAEKMAVLSAVSHMRSQLSVLGSTLQLIDNSPTFTDMHMADLRSSFKGMMWRLDSLELFIRLPQKGEEAHGKPAE